MAGREPGDDAVPGGQGEPGDEESADPACRFPDEVWKKFLTDSESAIRAFAPREPSALERTGAPPSAGPPAVPRPPRPTVPPAGESIGELWQPAEYRPSPAWRELDRRDRLLRVGRALGAVAAVATMVGLLSWLPTGSGTPSRNLRETAVRQSVESPGDQSASRTLPAELSTAKPSSATTGRARSNGRNAHGTRVRDDTDTDTDTETSSDTRSGSGTGSGSN